MIFTGYKFEDRIDRDPFSLPVVPYPSENKEKQDEATAQTVSMEVKCIGKECVNCPQLNIEICRDVLYGRTESVFINYLSCKNLGMCLRIKEHLRKNSNSDNEKDGV